MANVDWNIITIIVATAAVVVTTGGVWFQRVSAKISEKVGLSEMLRQFAEELQQVHFDIKPYKYDDFEQFSAFLLNATDRMVYLRDRKIILDDRTLMDFFRWNFQFAINMREIEMEISGRDITNEWEKTYRWCEDNDIKALSWEGLPEEIRSSLKNEKRQQNSAKDA